jgi:hypothetical protein
MFIHQYLDVFHNPMHRELIHIIDRHYNIFYLEPLIEKSSTTEHDKTQITFNAPIKPIRERIYSKLLGNVPKIRGKYFRTNFSHDLQYGSIDCKINIL